MTLNVDRQVYSCIATTHFKPCHSHNDRPNTNSQQAAIKAKLTTPTNQTLHRNRRRVPKGGIPNCKPPSLTLYQKQTRKQNLTKSTTQNSHIHSLLQYLQSIRHAYLSTTQPHRRNPTPNTNPKNATPTPSTNLTDPERDAVDTSTALLLRDLATSIANLSSAETLRQETSQTLLHKKYGHSAAGALLWRWAGGSGALDSASDEGKSAEQVRAEESARSIATIRESVLWFLRRGLECAVGVQRRMVEKRIERVREKEKSVLYKVGAGGVRKGSVSGSMDRAGAGAGAGAGGRGAGSFDPMSQAPDAAVLSEADTARIEAQLSPEQLQLFAEENDSMLKHYEDTLGKVQYVSFSFSFSYMLCWVFVA